MRNIDRSPGSDINTTPIRESYSRELDERVQMQERPYGYDGPPPPADSGVHNLGKFESRKGKISRGDIR